MTTVNDLAPGLMRVLIPPSLMVCARTGSLMKDVEEVVGKGGVVNMTKPRWDGAFNFVRSMNNNKRKLLLTAASLIATGIISGGIAVGVAAGAKVTAAGLTAAWYGFQKWRKKKKIAKANQSNYSTKEIDKWRDGQRVGVMQSKVVNDDYARVVSEVRYLVQHGGLTDMSNAYAALTRDFDRLTEKWASGPGIPVKVNNQFEYRWSLQPEDLVRSLPSLQLKRYIVTCNDAVDLWENLSRIGYRFVQVEAEFKLLDDLVMYSVGQMSKTTAMRVPNMRRLFASIAGSTTPATAGTSAGLLPTARSGEKMLDILAAPLRNPALKKKGWWPKVKEEDAWAYAYRMLPDDMKRTQPQLYSADPYRDPAFRLQLALLKKYNPAKYAEVTQKTLGEMYNGDTMSAANLAVAMKRDPKGFAKRAVAGLKGAGKLTGQGLEEWLKGAGVDINWIKLELDPEQITGFSADFAGKFIEEAIKEGVIKDSNKLAASFWADKVFIDLEKGAAFGKVAESVQGIVEAAVGVILERVNAAWEQWQLESGRTFNLFGNMGWSDQTRSQRVDLLRNLTKGKMDAYLDLVEEFRDLADDMERASSPERSAETLIRFLIAETVFDKSLVNEFFTYVVADVNYYAFTAKGLMMDTAVRRIDQFLDKHDRLCDDRSGYCYAKLGSAFSTFWGDVQAARKTAKKEPLQNPVFGATLDALDDCPCHPVGGKDNIKELLHTLKT